MIEEAPRPFAFIRGLGRIWGSNFIVAIVEELNFKSTG
jgi:hypothetical protein